MKRIKETIKEIVASFSKPAIALLPGHLSYSFVISFIPMLSLIGLIAYKFSISINSLKEFFLQIFPGETGTLITNFLNRDSIYFDGVLFGLLAITISSNGMYSVIRTSNILYDINKKDMHSVIKNRVKSFFMAFLMISLIIFMFLALGWGNSILNFFSQIQDFEYINEDIASMYRWIKYPISFFVIYTILKIIFTLAPNKKVESKSVRGGALFTSIALIFISFIYSFYVSLTHRYDILYGGLSNIIILFIWLYIVSFVFIVGFIINVNNSKKNKKDEGSDEIEKNDKNNNK